jgi:hypothetical protein
MNEKETFAHIFLFYKVGRMKYEYKTNVEAHEQGGPRVWETPE